MGKVEELLEKKKKIEKRLDGIKKRLGINTGARYGDELADMEFRVYSELLDEIDSELRKLKAGS